jgi:hypothetical protein
MIHGLHLGQELLHTLSVVVNGVKYASTASFLIFTSVLIKDTVYLLCVVLFYSVYLNTDRTLETYSRRHWL